MKSKCPICEKTKGKRDCLLKKGDLICPRCCAQVRAQETCTLCPHFQKAEEEKIAKLIKNGTLNTLIEIDPEIETAIEKALIQIESGKYSQAESTLVSLLERHPDHHMVQFGMGCLHAFQDQHHDSIPYFQKSVEIFPYFVMGWFNLGMSYRSTADIRGAVTCAEKVIQLGFPDSDEVLNNRTFLSNFKKHIKQEYGFTLEEYLDNERAFSRAFKEMENGDIHNAIQGFTNVLEREPTSHQSHGNLGLCHAMLGEKQKALAHLDNALALYPEYQVASMNRPIIEALEEGEKLDKPMQTVNYSTTGIKPIT